MLILTILLVVFVVLSLAFLLRRVAAGDCRVGAAARLRPRRDNNNTHTNSGNAIISVSINQY